MIYNFCFNNNIKIKMVKNFGGNKSKKLARKVISAPRDNKLRLPDSNQSDEQFACVSKMLGNGMCHVVCADQATRLCIIRNKFRGRSKRDNTLKPGTYLLIDVRSWESVVAGKIQKCDLLEVYNEGEKSRLEDTISFNWSIFKGIGVNSEIKSQTEDDDIFEFVEGKDIEMENDILKNAKETLQEDENILGNYDDEIDIDDI